MPDLTGDAFVFLTIASPSGKNLPASLSFRREPGDLTGGVTLGPMMPYPTVPGADGEDRKSTRLNSSHTVSSYAVFCLKKKKNTRTRPGIILRGYGRPRLVRRGGSYARSSLL